MNCLYNCVLYNSELGRIYVSNKGSSGGSVLASLCVCVLGRVGRRDREGCLRRHNGNNMSHDCAEGQVT